MLAATLIAPSLMVVVRYSRAQGDALVVGRYVIDPRGAVGQEIIEVARELLDGIKQPATESNVLVLWRSFQVYHQGLVDASREGSPLWGEQVLVNLRECHGILTSRAISGREWFVARQIWYWHARHDPDLARRETALACEELFRSRPKMALHFDWLFNDIGWKGHAAAMASLADRLTNDSSTDLHAFFESALALINESGDEQRLRKVEDLATRLGERAELAPHVRTFIASVANERTILSASAASIVAAHLGVIRRAGDLDRLRESIDEWSVVLTPKLFVEGIYLHGSVLVQANLTIVDWECLTRHVGLFFDERRWRLLGLAFGAEGGRTRELVGAEIKATVPKPDIFVWFWQGFHSRFIVTENHEKSALTADELEWFLELLALVPDLTAFGGSLADDLETVASHHPRHSASWLCNIVRQRRQWFVETGIVGTDRFWPVSNDRLFLSFVAQATAEDGASVEALMDYGYASVVVPYGLAELLADLDHDGAIVPRLVTARLSGLDASPENRKMVLVWAEYASMYPVGTPAWRQIAEAACVVAYSLPSGERSEIYRTLFDHRSSVWGAQVGEVSAKWTSAVEVAQRRLAQEPEGPIQHALQWHLEQVRADLEREGHLAEEEAASLRGF